MIRYIVHCQYVKSKNDGEIHVIQFNELCRLFGVLQAHCINAADSQIYNDQEKRISGYTLSQMRCIVHLWPQDSGDYDLKRVKLNHLMSTLEIHEENAKFALLFNGYDIRKTINWLTLGGDW